MTESLHIQAELLDSQGTYTRLEVCRQCSIDEPTLQGLLEHDVVSASTVHAHRFDETDLARLMKAARLHRDLQVNHAGVALAMQLLDTIERLDAEVASLRQRVQARS